MPKELTPVAPQIIDEASEWFVTMRDSNASAEDREVFAEWLRASPVHVGAYLEIARLWTDAVRIDGALPVDLDANQSPNVVPLGVRHPREASATDAAEGRKPDALRKSSNTRSLSRRMAIAASFAVALVAGGSWLYFNRAPAYTTGIGEQRTVTLTDGSVVKLNSRSTFKVQMSSNLREIELVDGQAFFEVAHDAKRPFIVTSGNSAIRAVGTQFDVNRKHSGTVITVIEGRVKLDTVAPESRSDEPGPLYLSAGEQIRVVPSGAMDRTPNPNTAAAVSWLRQELIFEDQPLIDVLEEFNRYSRTPIVLADPALGDLRINAVFHTTSPDSLLRFVSRYENVQVERSEKEIRISSRR
jgi:transmembrane sensor